MGEPGVFRGASDNRSRMHIENTVSGNASAHPAPDGVSNGANRHVCAAQRHCRESIPLVQWLRPTMSEDSASRVLVHQTEGVAVTGGALNERGVVWGPVTCGPGKR